ncbi:penicillin amidase [Palleronia marisminoris]|uniref:Penicillin acylase 2 n=1 Tax=Palleronia marisminoris TaxID=315423 RepID=A0A1Y5RLJ7_9RHOB|nr:penicillin acylase family protein [Palleronia marisminoris]SFG21734.1 penicillin amidase [Palleronia marisminoris]SLN17556.1 Penicillin acylase 2 precursor [Palleronia marisminoris]
MISVFRWLVRIFIGLALFAIVAVVVSYLFLSRSIPDYEGRFTVDGVTAPVEIVRNTQNVPHIFGETDADVFYGLGFAHAQDRLWQMTLLRRTAQGRLSEIFGSRTARTDELLRRLDLYNLARRSLEVQDDATTEALRAYSAGVNAWLAQVNEGARGRGAPEFWLFPPEFAPWQPTDSLAILKLMGLQLSSHATEEVLRARVSLALEDDARLADIMPDSPGNGIAALPEYSSLVPETEGIRYAAASGIADPLYPVAARGMGGASNAWAAGPSRSASGGTLLANDPHLGFTAPSIWYLARIELESGGIIGGTIPGMPVVMLGRSDQLGWGLTSSYADDQDVHIERLNPENSSELLTPDGYKPMRTRTSIVRIKDGADVTLTLRWSENGPVLPGRHWNLATVTPPGHVASLSWTVLSDEDTSMSAAMQLMKADTVEEALEASEDFIGPSQNLTVADRESIAMKTIGALPKRHEDHQSKGRLPTPGWIEANRWDGMLPYSQNPEFVDPDGGILGNTNNEVIDRPFPLHVSYHWGDTQRVQRWSRLMQGREVHTRESFMEAQLDTVSPTARSLLPLVGAELWFTGEAAPEGTPERLRQRALALLASWNGEMNEHLPEPLLYAAWMRALQDRLIHDELGPLAEEFTHIEPLFIERVYRNVDGAAEWCDVVQSARVEDCNEIARQALDEALIWITETYGRGLESLRWGNAHEALHEHAVLGEAPGIGWIVNIRQSTSGGDNTLLRGRTKGTGPDPFLNVHGAGYRGIYDFADPNSSVFISSTGQSGHPLSRHYDDLSELWRRGEYIPMTLDPDLARAGAVGITTLVPTRE